MLVFVDEEPLIEGPLNQWAAWKGIYSIYIHTIVTDPINCHVGLSGYGVDSYPGAATIEARKATVP